MTPTVSAERPQSVMTKPLEPPFLSHDAGALAGAVVLRPSESVDRLTPVHGEPSPIGERAIEQHGILVRTLRDRGVAVTELEPVLGTPAESLIGDMAVIFPKGALITRPSSVERRPQTATVEAALARLGIPVIGRIASPGLLDANDVSIGPESVYVGVPRPGAGLRPRSNELGRAQLEAIARDNGLRTTELLLASDTLRLRNVFSFIGRDTVIVAPERVCVVPITDLKIVEVPRGEEYAAGVLALGERRVLANLRFRESITLLRKAKITVEAIDLWEFGKAGAGPFSLVLATKRG
jgi:dimethylargininase